MKDVNEMTPLEAVDELIMEVPAHLPWLNALEKIKSELKAAVSLRASSQCQRQEIIDLQMKLVNLEHEKEHHQHTLDAMVYSFNPRTGEVKHVQEELTGEEVWLRVFEAVMKSGRGHSMNLVVGCCDDALEEFRKRFRSES